MNKLWNLAARQLARPAVASWLITQAMRRPYSHIMKNGDVYMERYWLFNPYPGRDEKRRWNFPISIRLHFIRRPDDDRDPHSHPWDARTILLRGWYDEVRTSIYQYDNELTAWCAQHGLPAFDKVDQAYHRTAGQSAALTHDDFHRITKIDPAGVWTMFITFRKVDSWYFLVDGLRVHWRKYLGLEQK